MSPPDRPDHYTVFIRMLDIIEIEVRNQSLNLSEEQQRNISNVVNKIGRINQYISVSKVSSEVNEVTTGDKFEKISESVITTRGSQAQAVAAGRGARVDAVELSSGGEIPSPSELRGALMALRASLREEKLSEEVLITAETAAGNALVSGVKSDEVKADIVTANVKAVADTLKEANVVVKEGSSLWESVQKLAPLLGPLVSGGAAAVITWFGLGR